MSSAMRSGSEIEQWGEKIAGLFQFQDQGILNYLIFAKSQRGEINVDWSDVQWSRNFGFDKLANDGAGREWGFPHEVKHPVVLHFCGRSPTTMNTRCFSQTVYHCSASALSDKHSKLVAWLCILRRDLWEGLCKSCGKVRRRLDLG